MGSLPVIVTSHTVHGFLSTTSYFALARRRCGWLAPGFLTGFDLLQFLLRFDKMPFHLAWFLQLLKPELFVFSVGLCQCHFVADCTRMGQEFAAGHGQELMQPLKPVLHGHGLPVQRLDFRHFKVAADLCQ